MGIGIAGTVAGAALGWGLCRLLQPSAPELASAPESIPPESVTAAQALPEPAPAPVLKTKSAHAPLPVLAPVPPPPPTPDPCAGTIDLPGLGFALGQAVIRLESFDTLDRALERLTLCPDPHVRVEGHSDSRGPTDLNQRLSRERAAAVQKYIVDAGIDAARVTSVGLGGEHPIASNETADGRALNRRVEIHFTDVPEE